MLAAAWRARRDNMPLGRDMKNSCCIDETLKVFLFLGKELSRVLKVLNEKMPQKIS